MIALRILALAWLCCVLVACGGGGGGNDAGTGATANPPPTTPPTTPPGGGSPNTPTLPAPQPIDWEQHSAQNAQLQMLFTGTVLWIDWIDLFDNELGFQVERRVGPGSWEIVESLPAITSGPGHWGRSVPVAASYRVTVVLPGRTIPLHSPGAETEIAIDPAPSVPATIQIDQSEPVRGAVQVSMQNAGPAAAVTYTLDGAFIARVTSGGTFAATVPVERLVDGQRELHAFIEKSPGLTLSLVRTLQVDNPTPAILMTFNTTPPHPAVTLSVRASSEAGITSVQFFIDGARVHVAYAPVPTTDQYAYRVDLTRLSPGTHVFGALATDGTNATVAMERTYSVGAAPTLNVTGLFDGMIATGETLRIAGEFSDDAAGATVTINVGDQRVVRTQTTPFSVDVALAGVPPGERSVSVRVQDAQGETASRLYRIIVPSTSLNYELIATDATAMLAADRGSLLYRKSSGQVVLRNPAGTETVLPNAPGWATYRMSEGHIVFFGPAHRVYRLDASGQPFEISQSPDAPAYLSSELPIVRGPWVSWRRAYESSTLRLYDLRTGLSKDVPIGDAMSELQHDIVTTPGSEQLLFRGSLNATPGIYSLNLQTNVTQLLVSGTVAQPRSDGTRLLWSDVASPPTEQFIAPLGNPAAATMLSTARERTLEGGLLCWVEGTTMFVNDGSVTTQLTTEFVLPMDEYTVEDGRVIFWEGFQMHVWSPEGGERVWLDATPVATIQADGVAYFLTGEGGPLYRVTLP